MVFADTPRGLSTQHIYDEIWGEPLLPLKVAYHVIAKSGAQSELEIEGLQPSRMAPGSFILAVPIATGQLIGGKVDMPRVRTH
jgi:hypothetical protein